MNLLLLRPGELLADGTARLRGRRLLHAREVLRLSEGDVLRAGVLNGPLGTAELLRVGEDEMVLRPALTEQPPPRPGVELLLALPRPKALRKILPAAASLGVDRIVLVNAARVEKSYLTSSCGFLLAAGLTPPAFPSAAHDPAGNEVLSQADFAIGKLEIRQPDWPAGVSTCVERNRGRTLRGVSPEKKPGGSRVAAR